MDAYTRTLEGDEMDQPIVADKVAFPPIATRADAFPAADPCPAQIIGRLLGEVTIAADEGETKAYSAGRSGDQIGREAGLLQVGVLRQRQVDLEDALAAVQATSLEGAFMQLCLYHTRGDVYGEHEPETVELDRAVCQRLIHSVIRCLERHTGLTRQTTGYWWYCNPEADVFRSIEEAMEVERRRAAEKEAA